MKKIIFFSTPLHGHTHPTYQLLTHLTARGYRIICYSLSRFCTEIEQTGAEYRAYPPISFDVTSGIKNLVELAETLLSISQLATPHFMPLIEAEKPDCIMHDSLILFGKILAAKYDIPAISSITTFAPASGLLWRSPQIGLTQLFAFAIQTPRLLRFLRQYRSHVQLYTTYSRVQISDIYYNSEKCNIVFTSRYLQPEGDRFDKSYHFIGPSINQELFARPAFLPKGKKIIYISLGTLYNAAVDFYRICITAFAPTDWHIVMAVGSKIALSDIAAPTNFTLFSYAPQLQILQHCDVFISHAGMNSISESMYYGVPMLLIPQMFEQRVNAQRVQQLGAGVVWRQQQMNATKLRALVTDMINDRHYKAAIQKIQTSFAQAGGPAEGAKVIDNYLKHA